MNLSLGQRIKRHRKNLGLTQRGLAKIIGVSFATLSRYEGDLRSPDAPIIKNLAKALKTTVDSLLSADSQEMSIQDSDELDLLRTFRGLNSLGRNRTLEYVSSLHDTPKYSNSDASQPVALKPSQKKRA
jgi:transcriptional regulator with XRE-family HTH domain